VFRTAATTVLSSGRGMGKEARGPVVSRATAQQQLTRHPTAPSHTASAPSVPRPRHLAGRYHQASSALGLLSDHRRGSAASSPPAQCNNCGCDVPGQFDGMLVLGDTERRLKMQHLRLFDDMPEADPVKCRSLDGHGS
jgi:hypothetical protein